MDPDTLVGKLIHDDRCDQQDKSLMEMKSDLRLLCERVPPNLKEELVRMNGKLDGLHSDFMSARAQWRAIVMIMVSGIIIGIVQWMIRGGLKP
jgi:hypothetical protein